MASQEPFGGKIGRTFSESTPWWPSDPHPPAGAPNVVVILLDDIGFSHFGCLRLRHRHPRHRPARPPAGSATRTSTSRRCARRPAPRCSPGGTTTRWGCGRSPTSTPASPTCAGRITHHAATVAEVLRDEGYATFAVGKWHLCPMEHASAAGPYDQWPCQRGFDRFYGFLDGETDQFHPRAGLRQPRVAPPADPEDGYHLSEDLVDHAIGFVHDTNSIRPDRPFFMYLAFGASHAPHQAPAAYLDKYRGRYDDGWDVARDRWFARQLELGLLPPGDRARAAQPGRRAVGHPAREPRAAGRPAPGGLRRLPRAHRRPDRPAGRRRSKRSASSTTRSFVLLSDNGASQEGGPFGVLHEMKYFNFLLETPDEAVARLDDIGGPHSHANYPWGWAQAGNTPFKWYKQNTHEGGVHVPLIVHWPRSNHRRRGAPRPVPLRQRHRPHHLRGARRRSARPSTAASSSCRSPARRCAYHRSTRPTQPQQPSACSTSR